MKQLSLIGWIALSLLIYTLEVFACSPAPSPSLLWPMHGQTGVPLNAALVFRCFSKSLCAEPVTIVMQDAGGAAVSTRTRVDSEVNFRVIPTSALAPSTEYTIAVEYSSRGGKPVTYHTFVTGTSVDDAPPSLDMTRMDVVIDYAANQAKASLFFSGMCEATTIDVAEFTAQGKWQEWMSDHYLPAHYTVSISTAGVLDDSGSVEFLVAEVGADGTLTDVPDAVSTDNAIVLPLIDDAGADLIKTYRVVATDIFGNVQPEAIFIQLTLQQSQSKSVVSTGAIDEGIGTTPDEDEEGSVSAAGGGCSLVLRAD